MKVALAILCIGAVAFLLRVLAAFVKEGMRAPAGFVHAHFTKFNPSRRRGQLIEMNPSNEVQMRKGPPRTDERIAL
jgi:hypothetical protein